MQKSFLSVLIVVLGLLLAVFVIQGSLSASTSSISTATKWIGLGLAVVCFVKPKAGFIIVMCEALTTDLLKKVATYYGTYSYFTVVEVMGVVMVALLCCYAGRLVQVTVGRDKFIPTEWLFYTLGAVIAFSVYLSTSGGLIGGQAAFNSGVYLGSGGLIVGMYRNFEDRLKIMNVLLILMTLWAALALKQRFFGFEDFQVAYHLSGLANVSGAEEWFNYPVDMPRPLGFGSNRVGFLGFAIVLAFCYFKISEISGGKRIWYVLVVILVFSCLILSVVKTAIVVSVVSVAPIYLIKKKGRTLFFYGLCVVLLLGMVLGASFLRENMIHINAFVKDTFGSEYNVATFNPRLEGYMELTNGKNWSLFGLSYDVKSHDVFTRILTNLGGIAFVSILFALAFLALYPHFQIWKMAHGKDRKLASMLLPATLAMGVSSMAGGLGFIAQPMPFLLSTGLGVVFASIVSAKETAEREREEG